MTFAAGRTCIKCMKFHSFLFSSAFNSAFVANVTSFVFKLELFTRLEVTYLLTESYA